MRGHRRTIAFIGVILAAAVLLPLSAYAAPLPLPPLPTPPPPTPVAAAPARFTGGFIELHAQFPQAWQWNRSHWQELWTVVQWQDGKGGAWRDVEGWQGSLDEIVIDEGGTVVGHKTWWVAKDDLGRGPFRWLVYRSQGATLFATSGPFDLPARTGETATIEMSLGP